MKARALRKSRFSDSLVNWDKIRSAAYAVQKISFFPSVINWQKLGSKHSPRPTFQNLNFELMDELRKVSANLNFTVVENKSHKKGWSHS